MEFKLCGPTPSPDSYRGCQRQTRVADSKVVAARGDLGHRLGRRQTWGKASRTRKLFSEHPDDTVPEPCLPWTFESYGTTTVSFFRDLWSWFLSHLAKEQLQLPSPLSFLTPGS